MLWRAMYQNIKQENDTKNIIKNISGDGLKKFMPNLILKA